MTSKYEELQGFNCKTIDKFTQCVFTGSTKRIIEVNPLHIETFVLNLIQDKKKKKTKTVVTSWIFHFEQIVI